MKTLSIVITRYKENLKTLKRLLNSIDNQSFKDIEVIISDDGYGSVKIPGSVLEGYDFPIYHISSPKKTVSKARNMGLSLANAKYIMFCDCDDCFYDENKNGLKNALEKMVSNDIQVLRSFIKVEIPSKSYGNVLSAIQKLDKDDKLILIDPKTITKCIIPNSVTIIGIDAFSFCDSLKEVNFKGKTLEEVKQMAGYPFGIEFI